MLRGDADFAFKTRVGLCRQDDRREFNGLRARAEDEGEVHKYLRFKG